MHASHKGLDILPYLLVLSSIFFAKAIQINLTFGFAILLHEYKGYNQALIIFYWPLYLKQYTDRCICSTMYVLVVL